MGHHYFSNELHNLENCRCLMQRQKLEGTGSYFTSFNCKKGCLHFFFKDRLWKLQRNKQYKNCRRINPIKYKEVLFISKVIFLLVLFATQTFLCSGQKQDIYHETVPTSTFCEDLQISKDFDDLSVELFCEHYQPFSLFPRWHLWLENDDVNINECEMSLQTIIEKDKQAQASYLSFLDMMTQYATPDDYSIQWQEHECQTAYKVWMCSHFHTIYDSNNQSSKIIQPCPQFCHLVEKSCPFFRIFNKTKLYGGQSTFLCSGVDIPSTEESEVCYNSSHRSFKQIELTTESPIHHFTANMQSQQITNASSHQTMTSTSCTCQYHNNTTTLSSKCCSSKSPATTLHSYLHFLFAIISFLINTLS